MRDVARDRLAQVAASMTDDNQLAMRVIGGLRVWRDALTPQSDDDLPDVAGAQETVEAYEWMRYDGEWHHICEMCDVRRRRLRILRTAR